MKLSREEVEHIAELGRLNLSEEEKARYQDQLSAILEYFESLREVDTSAIPPTASVLSLRSVMRPDQARPSLPRAEVLANAPASVEGQFRVPGVLD